MTPKRTRQGLIALSVCAAMVACLWAQLPAKARKVIYTKENFGTNVSEHVLSLDDASDHKLTQSFRIDAGRTSDPEFDIAQEFVYEHGDTQPGDARYSGYSTYMMRNGDRVYLSWASTPVTKTTVPGEAPTIGSGSIRIYGGTGRYKNISGRGTYRVLNKGEVREENMLELNF